MMLSSYFIRIFYNMCIFFSTYNSGIGTYFDVPAILTEEVQMMGKFVRDFKFDFMGQDKYERFWILGASYNTTSQILANKQLNCGENSCYTESLYVKKICKPGTLDFA